MFVPPQAVSLPTHLPGVELMSQQAPDAVQDPEAQQGDPVAPHAVQVPAEVHSMVADEHAAPVL